MVLRLPGCLRLELFGRVWIGSARLVSPRSRQYLPRAEQVGQADQVVGHHMQPEHGPDP